MYNVFGVNGVYIVNNNYR